MDIHLDLQLLITLAAAMTALVTLIAFFTKAHNWFLEQKNQSDRIDALKEKHNADMAESNEERQLMCYALSACLDGLQQLGCNHSVTEAKQKMDKHLNEKAHAYLKGAK